MEPITGARIWELIKQAEDMIPHLGAVVSKLDAFEREEISRPLYEFVRIGAAILDEQKGK
jgi:hypothetical protein